MQLLRNSVYDSIISLYPIENGHEIHNLLRNSTVTAHFRTKGR